jgi:hypothetical protein
MESRRGLDAQPVRKDDWTRPQFTTVFVVTLFILFLTVVTAAFGPALLVVKSLTRGGVAMNLWDSECKFDQKHELLAAPVPHCWQHKIKFHQAWTDYFHIDAVATQPDSLVAVGEDFPVRREGEERAGCREGESETAKGGERERRETTRETETLCVCERETETETERQIGLCEPALKTAESLRRAYGATLEQCISMRVVVVRLVQLPARVGLNGVASQRVRL